MIKLGKKIREVRDLRKLTQAELAERAGLQPAAISHFERDLRQPSLQNFVKLYKALRVHPGALLGEGGESIYDLLPMEDIAFLNLVREAVINRHKRYIRKQKEIDRAHQEPGHG